MIGRRDHIRVVVVRSLWIKVRSSTQSILADETVDWLKLDKRDTLQREPKKLSVSLKFCVRGKYTVPGQKSSRNPVLHLKSRTSQTH